MDVSVLIPVLDEAAHLREAAARMTAQDFAGDVEFLFIDGGSEDASPAILRELAEADPRIRVLANPDRRTPFALNIGLRAARGEFVARMDAHTRYPPSYLRLGVERLRRGGAVSVSGPQIAAGDGQAWSDRVALALSTSADRRERSIRWFRSVHRGHGRGSRPRGSRSRRRFRSSRRARRCGPWRRRGRPRRRRVSAR